MDKNISSRIFGGIMLVAGTSIGAAILAMPILTGLFGFLGTLVVLVLVWAFMYWVGTLILEACLHFPKGASFISLSRILGPTWSSINSVTFLLLFYSLVAAYLSSSGVVIIDSLETFFGITLPPFIDMLPLLVLLTPFIYFGLSVVDRLNRYMVAAMFVSYAMIVFLLLPKVEPELLAQCNFYFAPLSFSVVVTSFGFHVVVPTLVSYLDGNIKSIKRCLFYGSLIPLVFYAVWELVTLGTLPVDGSFGLAQALSNNHSLSKLFALKFNSNLLSTMVHSFSMLAIVTSFLGVAQGLFDFIKDGIKATTRHKERLLALLLTFLPPVILILFFESGFVALLEYAGALVSVALGIIPILVVWRLRQENPKGFYQAAGGKTALVAGVIFFALVVLVVIFKNLGLLNLA
jgi:tyrosine-specific transport protein